MAHYKLTDERREIISRTMTTALEKRVELAKKAFDLTADELERLAYPEHDLDALRHVRSFYEGVVEREYIALSAELEANGRRFLAVALLKLTTPIFWPYESPPSLYGHSARDPRKYQFIVKPSDAYERSVLAVPPLPHTAANPTDARERVAAWFASTLRSVRVAELGFGITGTLLSRSETLTNVVATLPDVKALLRDSEKGAHMIREMDRAPVRTLRNYRVTAVDTQRLDALRSMIAESLILPKPDDTPEAGPVKVTRFTYQELTEP